MSSQEVQGAVAGVVSAVSRLTPDEAMTATAAALVSLVIFDTGGGLPLGGEKEITAGRYTVTIRKTSVESNQ